jgi:hypothetical protein
MRHLRNLTYRATRHGLHMFAQARHYGHHLHRAVHTAAHVYSHAIQPALQAANFDTRASDRSLKTAYDHYNQFQDSTAAGLRVADNLAAHLRSGYSYE